MAIATKREPLTYHDLENFPEDGKIREVLGGDLCVSTIPSTLHQITVGEMLFSVRTFLQAHPLGTVIVSPVEVVFTEEDAVQPDVVFVSHAKRSIIAEKRIMGAPDWVIEVLSPSSRERDLETKRKLYARHGVVYWVLDPEANRLMVWDQAGEQHYGVEDDDVSVSVLPGFRLDLDRVFQSV